MELIQILAQSILAVFLLIVLVIAAAVLAAIIVALIGKGNTSINVEIGGDDEKDNKINKD